MLIFLKLLSILSIGAVLDNGIFGKAKNKLGNVVLFVWKGINAARSYVIPTNPNTTSQKAQRNLMKQMVSYAQVVLIPFIHKYLNPFAVKMSGYNLFIQRNRNANFPGTQWINKVYTVGSLPVPSGLEFFDGPSGNVSWNDAMLPPGLLPTDLVCTIVNKQDGSFKLLKDNVMVSAGIIPMPNVLSDTDKVVLFTYRESNGIVTTVSTAAECPYAGSSTP